ncbi:MAG TPA: hypothetical protein ENK19_12680 [Acidobacteria bacterium]|nr:hypothetical protein [Acidobacteriota bacterium]
MGRQATGNPLPVTTGWMVLAVLMVGFWLPGTHSARAEDHGAAVFECVPCGMKFSNEKEWARHEIKVHGAKGCEECGVLYHGRLEEAAHEILRHGATHCSACGRDFRSNRAAVDHLVSIHHLPHCSFHNMVFANDQQARAHAAKCPAFRAEYKRWKAEQGTSVRAGKDGGATPQGARPSERPR